MVSFAAALVRSSFPRHVPQIDADISQHKQGVQEYYSLEVLFQERLKRLG